MKRIGKGMSLLIIVTALATTSLAQVATGLPPFSTINGGPFDRVNLGNLNFEFAVSMVSKPGRGIPFNFSLVYNSSVWAIYTSNGHSAWTPAGGTFLGWQGTQGMVTPYVTYWFTSTSNLCGPSQGGPPPYSYQQSTFSNFVYHDQWGGQHAIGIPQTYYSIYNSPGPASSCPPNGPQPNTPQSGLANDDSGYTLNLQAPNGTSISGNIVDSVSPEL